MKAFQDFIRNNLNVYADTYKIINKYTDENEFNWISEFDIIGSTKSYKMYSLPARYTESLKTNITINKCLTQNYGYYIEENCVMIYIHEGYKPNNTTLISLLKCHDYALFIHKLLVNIGGTSLEYIEDMCVLEGLYFTVKIDKENGKEIYNLSGILKNTFKGIILVSEWSVSSEDVSTDIRNICNIKPILNGKTISESIVRKYYGSLRQCICIDAYIGADNNYNIFRQHEDNMISIKSEASHKGLALLLKAGDASSV